MRLGGICLWQEMYVKGVRALEVQLRSIEGVKGMCVMSHGGMCAPCVDHCRCFPCKRAWICYSGQAPSGVQ